MGTRAGPHPHGSNQEAPLLGVVNSLVRDGKFSDFKAELNYMLSPTRRGYDGPITHAIYQQDICIHNKPTAKQSISVSAQNVKSGHDVGPSHLPGGGGRGSPRASLPLHVLGVRTHWDLVASTPGMHSPHNELIPNLSGMSAVLLPKGRGWGAGGEIHHPPPARTCSPQSPGRWEGCRPGNLPGCGALG